MRSNLKASFAYPKNGDVNKVFLILLAVIVLALIGGCLYFESRRPHFGGKSPSTIEVCFFDFFSRTNDYRISITNRAVCENIFREFNQARPVLGATKAVGKFTIHYDNGNTDIVWFLPGTVKEHYTIFLGDKLTVGGTFHMRKENVYQVLKAGGVDVSKIQD